MQNSTIQNNNEVMEIDLMELFRELRRHILMILAVTAICGAITFLVSRFCITPKYESTSSLYILTKETTLTSLADLQIGSQLTNDYKVIVTSRPVLQDVVDALQLEDDYKKLRERLKIDNPENTRILTITIEDPDPQLAKSIVDTVAETSSGYIADTMEMVPPKIIETGEVSDEKSSPSNGKNAVIGAIAGFVIICGLYCVRVIVNDAVTTPEDVEKYLGINVLASVPLREDAGSEADDKAGISGSSKKKVWPVGNPSRGRSRKYEKSSSSALKRGTDPGRRTSDTGSARGRNAERGNRQDDK